MATVHNPWLLFVIIIICLALPSKKFHVHARTMSNNNRNLLQISTKVSKFIRSSVVATTIPLLLVQSGFPNRVLANEPTTIDVNCIKNVLRVKTSLKYIETDIEKVADLTKVINDIKSLQKNYRLEENIIKSVNLASTSRQKETAREHGNQAVENLASIYEYFAGDVDDMTGKIKTTPKTLSFALDATKAAEKELGLLTDELPSNLFLEASEAVKEEFTTTTS